VALTGLLLAAASRRSADACECLPADFREAVRTADLVVVGTAVQEKLRTEKDGSWLMPLRNLIVLKGEPVVGGVTIGSKPGGGCEPMPAYFRQPFGDRFAFALSTKNRGSAGEYLMHFCPPQWVPLDNGKPPPKDTAWKRRYSLPEIQLLARGEFAKVESERAYHARRESEPTRVPDVLLDRPLKTYDGGTLKLRNYLGRVVVVGFWVSPQEGLLPELLKLHRAHRQDEFQVIGFPAIGSSVDARTMAARLKIEFPLIRSDDEFEYGLAEYTKFGYMSSPGYFVISPDGFVVKRIRGLGAANASALVQSVEAALANARKVPPGQSGKR
jgi:hypothetical protein